MAMIEQYNPDAAVVATVAMYDQIPGVLGGHFAKFRELPGIHSALDDMRTSHRYADVPLGESSLVEIGPGDGRDAVEAFVPYSDMYTGFGPAKGENDIARKRVSERYPNLSEEELARMFQLGFAQSADYPEDVDVTHAVNSFTVHTPFNELPSAFDRIGESLRQGGVLHLLTKAATKDLVEYNPGEKFEGAEGMEPRTFYVPSIDTLQAAIDKARLTVVHED